MGISRTSFFAGIDRTVLTLWVGGLWISGYLVAPTLFSMLNDRQLAGLLAGQIFQSMNYIGLIAGGYLIVAIIVRTGSNSFRQWKLWVLVSMLILVIIAAFVIQPMMQELKTQGISEGTMQAKQFGRLHGLSSVLFLINSILGLLLVTTGLDRKKG